MKKERERETGREREEEREGERGRESDRESQHEKERDAGSRDWLGSYYGNKKVGIGREEGIVRVEEGQCEGRRDAVRGGGAL